MSGLKQLAIEAGMHYRALEDEFCKANADGVPMEMLEAFAKLVAAKEREACARVCEQDKSQAGEWTPGSRPGGYFAKTICERK